MRVGRTVVLGPNHGNDQASRVVRTIITLVVLILIPGFVYMHESRKYEMGRAFFEATEIIEEIPDDQTIYPSLNNKLIHFTSNKIETTEVLHDPDFGLESMTSVKLSRKTEFCQWEEHHSDRKENGHTVRTYYYTKSWRPYTVISTFFDQPFKHNNPQRNPTPAYSISANSVKAGAFTVTRPLIDNLPISNTLHFTESDLSRSGFYGSSAFRDNGFKYIGGGYFYSAYQASTEHMLFKLAGEYLEGSLFDIQVGDLFQQCTAGDIRVRFDVAIPTTVSAIGQQVGDKVVPYITAHNFNLALLHHGTVTPQKMFETEMNNQQLMIYIARVILLIFSFFVASMGFRVQGAGPVLLGGLFITGIVVGMIWLLVWGTFSSLFLAAISGVGLFFVHATSAHKAPPKM